MLKVTSYILLALASLLGLLGAAIGLFCLTVPSPSTMRGCLTTEMYHVHLCAKDASYVKLKDISVNARNALIVSEDGAFYSHHGFDWDEMRMSLKKNLKTHEYARGGSTITQQLAKNVYLNSEKSMLRKLREAIITMQIEKTYSKNEILEKYFNVVEYGQGLYGIGKASQYYFNKSASQLSVAEGAFLAFLLPNPKKYSASFRAKQLTPFARHQTREIIERLHRYNRIPEDEYAGALAQVDHLFGGVAPTIEPAPENIQPSPEEQGPPEETGGDVDIVL